MAYQFIHYETYSASDARRVIGEAVRIPENSPHVRKPEPPVFLFGQAAGLADKIEALAASTKMLVTQRTRSGEVKTFERALRPDAAVFLAGVISFPREWSEQNPRLFAKAKKDAVKELNRRYGDQLQTAIFHDDEEHPHIHFFVLPNGLDMSNVCRATAAERLVDVAKSKATGKARQAARSQALQLFQDEWHDNVMRDIGLGRYGPKRQRQSRPEWKAENAMRITIANAGVKADDTRKALAGACGAMLSQQRAHQNAIGQMNTRATAIESGLSSAQKIEVAKAAKGLQAVADVLGL